jgi:hypothetical protein
LDFDGSYLQGSAAGNPYAIKAEDGSFDKTAGATYTHQTTTMSEELMVEPNRLIYFEFWKSWDETMWEERGLKKQDGENFNSVLLQAPQVMAPKAAHGRREAQGKYDKVMKSAKEETIWYWVKAPKEHQAQKAHAVLQNATHPEGFLQEKCKETGRFEHLASDAGKKQSLEVLKTDRCTQNWLM